MRTAASLAGIGVLVITCALVASGGPSGTTPDQQPQMSAEEKKMMDAMIAAGTPGKEHKWLASKAGTWDFSGKFWMQPGAPPVESKGTVERVAQLGGRVLSERVTSPGFMGQPFEGFGLSGYDNMKKQFWSTWTDNMSTAIMVSNGTCDEKGSCKFTGTYIDPVTNAPKTMIAILRDEGPDKEIHEGFETGADGKEMKTMELVYTRSK